MAILLIVCVSLSIGFFALMNYSLIKEETEGGVSSLRYLRSVILMYSEDARKEGRTAIFPDSLKTLVKENYLNDGDLHDFDGLAIEVIQPDGNGLPSDIILQARSRHKLFECPLEGEIQVKSLQ